ncbi:hypothetical protein RSSM_03938 [Rhodopirellula sallentina SM41]|uniref:Uncharacterized protein n=1 Tax=Rhodopirellula sallentina SM41 TaxID=1263870 RepID=M5UF58_9BACT|nr:hypothetical protein RSSM_03938 [Rhodopirellula sallentina SM41]
MTSHKFLDIDLSPADNHAVNAEQTHRLFTSFNPWHAFARLPPTFPD